MRTVIVYHEQLDVLFEVESAELEIGDVVEPYIGEMKLGDAVVVGFL